jgi:hypothetical protein
MLVELAELGKAQCRCRLVIALVAHLTNFANSANTREARLTRYFTIFFALAATFSALNPSSFITTAP